MARLLLEIGFLAWIAVAFLGLLVLLNISLLLREEMMMIFNGGGGARVGLLQGQIIPQGLSSWWHFSGQGGGGWPSSRSDKRGGAGLGQETADREQRLNALFK